MSWKFISGNNAAGLTLNHTIVSIIANVTEQSTISAVTAAAAARSTLGNYFLTEKNVTKVTRFHCPQ